MHRRTHAVQSVTNVRRSLSEDVEIRQHRYLLIMGIRIGFLVAAVFAPVPVWGRVIFIAAAILLPYAAVIDANSRSRGVTDAPEVPPGATRPAIEAPKPDDAS